MVKKIQSSLSVKIFIIISSILLVSGLIIYGIVMFYLPHSYKIQITEKFQEDFHKLVQTIDVNNIEKSATVIQDFCSTNKTFVRVKSIDNTISYEWKAENISLPENSKYSSSIIEYVGKGDNDKDLIVFTNASMESVNQVTDIFYRILPMIIITILLISIVGSLFCSCYISKPIVEISRIAKHMSELDLSWRSTVNRVDEIGVLSESLNNLACNLSKTMTKLNQANDLLKQDYEKEKRREKHRRDFFNAVSHEFKTPITLLKCTLEGMIYNLGIYKDRDKYLVHAKEVTESLESLVREILTVSKLGDEDFKLNCEKTNIGALINSCCMFHEELAQTRKIKMKSVIKDNIFCYVDVQLLKKAISNIIDNAIVHSPANHQVRVRLDLVNERCLFTVENTGVQLNEDDMENIFSPFYRIEKSRNRHSGGSGLGLYIVKVILSLHKLPFKIENVKNAVRFTVEFKNIERIDNA